MDLSEYVDGLRRSLTAAAAAGGEQARETARLLADTIEPAVRLTVIDALSAMAEEVTAALEDSLVDIRVRGRDPEVVVVHTPGEPDGEPADDAGAGDDDGATARISLRLPDSLLDRVEVTVHGSRLRVAVPERRVLFRCPAFAVRATVPPASAARVAVLSADAALRGPLGRLELTTGSGEVDAESCETLQLRTASGDARIGRIAGSATLGSASGDLRIDSLGGELEARTASGDVTVGEADGDLSVGTASGDVRVDRAKSGSVRVRTVSGDVTVGVAPGLRVWLDLSSVSGRMDSRLTEDDDAAGTGPAELSIAVQSVSGNARIRPVPLAS